MRRLINLVVLLSAMAFVLPLLAHELSQGEMAGIIRSANFPCAKVLTLQSNGEHSWIVECNSGRFDVTKDSDDEYTVTASEG